MKTIVAATDFSTNANRAVHVAAQLAKAQHASLVLTNAFHFWPTNPPETGMDFPLSAQFMREESEHQLRQLGQQLRQEVGPDVPIRYITKEGYAIPSILDVVKAEDADLLVMSIVGSAPQGAQLMGSVATDMIAETTIPLLLIPPTVDAIRLDNIVLGVDLRAPINAVTLDTVIRLAKRFGSVLDVLCVVNGTTDADLQSRSQHLRHLLEQVPHTFTLLPGQDVYETVSAFAHEHKAGLIMMLPQDHNWLWRLFAEGQTQRMARLTDLPLLAVV